MENADYAELSIRAFSASEALPIENAIVKINGASETNSDVSFSLITDEDGVTPGVMLPAPSASYSLEPQSTTAAYGIYDVEVRADGYYTKRLYNIPVFSGVSAVLPVNMIAFLPTDEGGRYPRGNINALLDDGAET